LEVNATWRQSSVTPGNWLVPFDGPPVTLELILVVTGAASAGVAVAVIPIIDTAAGATSHRTHRERMCTPFDPRRS
jgi:hypothetical protein